MVDTNRLDCSPSISSLVGGIIGDAQQLIRQEMELARREIQTEVQKAKAAAMSMALGAGMAFMGSVLLCFMLVHLLYWATNDLHERFPLWASFGIVGAVLAAVGAGLLYAARAQARAIHLVPPQTAQTMRENVRWIKNPK
jgi:pheromone shutdown protein TraB